MHEMVKFREKVPSDKTPALAKSTNRGIWVFDTSNHLFIRGLWWPRAAIVKKKTNNKQTKKSSMCFRKILYIKNY